MARPYEKQRAYELSRRADELMSKLRLGMQRTSEIDRIKVEEPELAAKVEAELATEV